MRTTVHSTVGLQRRACTCACMRVRVRACVVRACAPALVLHLHRWRDEGACLKWLLGWLSMLATLQSLVVAALDSQPGSPDQQETLKCTVKDALNRGIPDAEIQAARRVRPTVTCLCYFSSLTTALC